MGTTTKSVPFFNYSGLYKKDEQAILGILSEVMSRGAFILQKDVAEFEAALAQYLNVKLAFGVADGSNALTIALLASGIQRGDEVILPSHTFIATPAAVVAAGAIPVLADCGRDHLIDPTSVESLITGKTRAILPVHLNGRTSSMGALTRLAKERDLIIVEDAAQALGSRYKNQMAGTFGKAGTFSFYPAKSLGCFGDGGAVVTNDETIAESIYQLRDHGRDREGNVQRWGFNCRLDNIQAAILLWKLKSFDTEIATRRRLAAIYDERLSDVPQLLLPPTAEATPDHFDVYQNYEIEAENRDALKSFLQERGVRTLIQWGGKAVHQFEPLGFREVPPYTETLFRKCLLLPMNTLLTEEDVHYVADQVLEFYGRGPTGGIIA